MTPNLMNGGDMQLLVAFLQQYLVVDSGVEQNLQLIRSYLPTNLTFVTNEDNEEY